MRFGILGPFEVIDDHGRVVALGGPKQRSVLAILLLHAGEVVSSERLIDELWGERAPASAANTLQVYVSKLCKALGDGMLLTRGGGYVLQSDRGEVDVDRFLALLAAGRRALQTGDPRGGGESLREALGLWRGPPLSDLGAGVCHEHRRRLM
jgi:DNA-binding SARP family transcriptional activator